jgi:Na+-transporting NADH:ubiquinone oxidoreductase subunit A
MGLHTIRRGLDLPITGEPEQRVGPGRSVTRVGVVAGDFPGMKPKMAVKVGDLVRRGQLLFEDRKSEGVRHTSPAAGRVAAIHRGEFRRLVSIVVELAPAEREGVDDPDLHTRFAAFSGRKPEELAREDIVALLVESGVWTALRQRPFGRVPSPKASPPHSIFVNAMDSNPLAADPAVAIAGREAEFERGLALVAELTAGKTYLCKRAGARIGPGAAKGIEVEEFAGPHPAGTSGLHIHLLDPVSRRKQVWYLGWQDVVQIGRLFCTGKLDPERVIALGGPQVKKPRLLVTRQGADLGELTAGELEDGENRIVSGSVLHGHAAGPTDGFLGRYHGQVSVLREDRERRLFGWLSPGAELFSVSGAYASRLTPGRKFAFTTTTHGSARYMVPIGMYERVFPFDIMPTFLLRALAVDDLERAEQLGVLELDEEDLSLCTFVDPGKHDYGVALRRNLDTIWKEG